MRVGTYPNYQPSISRPVGSTFVNQTIRYIFFTIISFFITTYIRGEAKRQITLYLRKYLDKANNKNKITLLFKELINFKDYIYKVFSAANKEKKIKYAIQKLLQKRFTVKYIADFQYYIIIIGQNNKALKAIYL